MDRIDNLTNRLTIQRLVFLCALWSIMAMLTGCYRLPKHLQNTGQRLSQPPPGKAMVNFHRPTKYGLGILYPIFTGDGKFVCDIDGRCVYQHICDPGEQLFIGWAEQVSAIKANLLPDKVYDVMVDVNMGWVQAHIRMVPLRQGDPRRQKLAEYERRERNILAMTRAVRVEKYEAEQFGRVADINRDFNQSGNKESRLQYLDKDDCR